MTLELGRPRGGFLLAGLAILVASGCGSEIATVRDLNDDPAHVVPTAGREQVRSAPGPDGSSSLPITLEADDPTDPEGLSTAILRPTSCILRGGVVTATGDFARQELPDAYGLVGAVVELYVYANPAEPVDQGRQLARLRAEQAYPISGPGPWTVTVPLEGPGRFAARCEVAIQPTHRSTREVTATARALPAAPAIPLHFGVEGVGSAALGISQSSLLQPVSCVREGDVVTARGTFRGERVPEAFQRRGDVVRLYVYAAPTISSPTGMQLADLSGEHTFSLLTAGPWVVSTVVDPMLGEATRCGVAVQQTHHFEAPPNAY
jgi:hypothetical protein